MEVKFLENIGQQKVELGDYLEKEETKEKLGNTEECLLFIRFNDFIEYKEFKICNYACYYYLKGNAEFLGEKAFCFKNKGNERLDESLVGSFYSNYKLFVKYRSDKRKGINNLFDQKSKEVTVNKSAGCIDWSFLKEIKRPEVLYSAKLSKLLSENESSNIYYFYTNPSVLKNEQFYNEFKKLTDEYFSEDLKDKSYSSIVLNTFIAFLLKKYENKKFERFELESSIKYVDRWIKNYSNLHIDDSPYFKKMYPLLKQSNLLDYLVKIKDLLRVKEDKIKDLHLGHYTRLETLKHLLKKDEEVKIRLSHVAQMNDPLEGKVLMSCFGDEYYNTSIQDVTFSKFILCLTSNLNSLPMWAQYGDQGQGLALEFNNEYLRHFTSDEFSQSVNGGMYEVCYIRTDGKRIKVHNPLNSDYLMEVEKEVNNLLDYFKGLDSKLREKNLPRIQQEIGYIFKKDDYAYEEEFRILIESNDESNIIDVKHEEHQVLGHKIPGLFCYLDLQKDDKQVLLQDSDDKFEKTEQKFSKIIFGPKSIDIDYLFPYIAYCDDRIVCEKSEIKFR